MARTEESISAFPPSVDRRFRHLDALYELADVVTGAAVPLDEVYREAVRVAGLALEADRTALLVCDEGGVMRFRAWRGLSDAYRAATEGHSPWAPDEPQALPVLIEDVERDASLDELRKTVLAEGIRALAFVPLVARGHPIGKFMLYHDRPHVFGKLELRLVATIAATVAVAIERRRMEEELRASNDQLHAVFESVADGITVLDRQGRFVFANEAAARLCGFDSSSELMATPTARVMDAFQLLDEQGGALPPEQLPARRVLAGESEAELLVRYRRRGEPGERWSNVRATPILDERGEIRCAVSVFRDVTDEHQAEERQRLRARASLLVGGTLGLPETLERVASLFVPELADWCAIHLVEGAGAPLGAVVHREPGRLALARTLGERFPPDPDRDRGLAGLGNFAVPTAVSQVDDDILGTLGADERRLIVEAEVSSLAAAPIPGAGRPLGLVTLAGERGRRLLEEHDLGLAVELAASAAFPIQNARLHAAEREAREGAERAASSLARLQTVADAVLQAGSLDDLLNGLVSAVQAALGSDRATLLLLEDDDELVLRAAAGIEEEIASTVRVPLGEGVAGRIAATQSPWIVDDLSTVEVVSSYLQGGGSLAGVPLLFGGRLLGVLHASSKRTGAFGAEDLEFLKIAAERAATGIEQTRLSERQHELASALQRSLLPERFPRVPGLAIAASYLPAADGARVGGDWYDAFPLGDGRVLLAVGDVVGHGIDAAASMGQVRNALRAYALEDPAPQSVCARLNALLLEISPREFCTAFCAVLDPWAGTIDYVSAGHPPPLTRAPAGELRFLDAVRSVPLGALPDARFDCATDSLEPGALLFAYTDGLVERRDAQIDERLDTLCLALARAGETPLRRLPEEIAAALLDGHRLDDVAILAAQLATSTELHLRVPAEPASLAVVRRALRSFLERAGAAADEAFELQVACGEACANVVEHAYGTRTGLIRVHAAIVEDAVRISVRDTGSWRQSRTRTDRGGHGLPLIRAFAHDVEVRHREPTGTDVVLVRRLAAASMTDRRPFSGRAS